jgi:hypothetical protein
MADFARWISRCEGAFGLKDGTLLADYRENRGEAVEAGLESDPLAGAIRSILNKTNPWEGTATKLIEKIKSVSEADERYLPTIQKLKSRLNRLGPNLRKVGIEWDRKHTREGNLYYLEFNGLKASFASHASQSSSEAHKQRNGVKQREAREEGVKQSKKEVHAQKQSLEAINGDREACEANEANKQQLSKDIVERFNEDFNKQFDSDEAPF